jgi:hypothetical protein
VGGSIRFLFQSKIRLYCTYMIPDIVHRQTDQEMGNKILKFSSRSLEVNQDVANLQNKMHGIAGDRGTERRGEKRMDRWRKSTSNVVELLLLIAFRAKSFDHFSLLLVLIFSPSVLVPCALPKRHVSGCFFTSNPLFTFRDPVGSIFFV